jgi:erythromycin esterase
VHPLYTLDPAAPLDDLEWLDQAVGDARVVAIGEGAHYNRESFQLRHRLLRYLVERHGFNGYAMESGFVEGWRVDRWVRGGDDQLGPLLANGATGLMGMWTQVRDHLAWMRGYNSTAARPVGYYGIDTPGSNVSLLPGLDAVLEYLADADPEYQVDPAIRETAAAFAAPSAFSAPAATAAYGALAAERRNALTAGLADLTSRMTAGRLAYRRRTSDEAYERASRTLAVTVALDGMARALARGSYHDAMTAREVTIADTVDWILRRADRIVLVAHNAHVQRWPGTMPGLAAVTMMGMHVADRWGDDYRVIGMTTGSGQTLNTSAEFYAGQLFAEQPPPEPGSLDALMAASHDGMFATDLRRLSPVDEATVRAVTRQRYGPFYSELSPLDAYDVVVHLPHVTAADPDADAVASAPDEVRRAFSHWKPA